MNLSHIQYILSIFPLFKEMIFLISKQFFHVITPKLFSKILISVLSDTWTTFCGTLAEIKTFECL